MDVDKTYVPAEEAPARARARLFQPHEHSGRPECLEGAPRQGPQAPERVGLPGVVLGKTDAQWGAD